MDDHSPRVPDDSESESADYRVRILTLAAQSRALAAWGSQLSAKSSAICERARVECAVSVAARAQSAGLIKGASMRASEVNSLLGQREDPDNGEASDPLG